MKPVFFYSIQSLVRAVDSVSGSVETVSVDVFDTLLVRRVHEPDLVKRPVCRFVARRAQVSGIHVSCDNVLKIRNDIEREHRLRNGAIYPDQEACYPDFMRETLDKVFRGKCPAGFLKEVAEYELSVEKSMIVPRAPFAEMLERLHDSGKRVIAITDIYMPSLYIREILEHASVLRWIDHVFSSADTFKAKASGAAYRMLVEQHGIQPDKWLHIGDNPFSDGLRPAAKGIRSFVLRDALEKKRKAVARRYWICSEKSRFWKGRYIQQLMLPIENEAIPEDQLYIAGYNFLCPLFCSFMMHVAERIRELNISRIYFLSREGYLFKQIWERLIPVLYPHDHEIHTHYLYASRIALAGTSCAYQGMTHENARIAFLPPRNRDFRDLCRVFGVSVEPLLPFLERHGLKPDDPLSPLHSGHKHEFDCRFDALLGDDEFQKAIRRQALDANRALELYLKDQHFFEQDDVALVDIGWLGSIPRFLHESIKHRADHPRLHGFLLAATRGIEYPTSPGNYIEGWFFDRHRFNLAGSVITYALDFFEEACRAPHPGLMRYRMKSGDDYELVFRAHDDEASVEEEKQNLFNASLQQGVLDGVRRFAYAALMLGCKADDMRGWLNCQAVSRLAFPGTDELVAMRHQYHLDDFMGKHVPVKKFRPRQLWDMPAGALRFVPFIRTFFYFRHLAQLLFRY